MDIEEVAEKTPHLIFKEEIDPGQGLLPFQAGGLHLTLDYQERHLRKCRNL